MSRRSSHNNNNNNRQAQEWNPVHVSASNNNRNLPKYQKKFVPRGQTLNPNPGPTLSGSLRDPQSDASASASSSGRVRMGDGGEWVPNWDRRGVPGGRGVVTGGSFVNYLPQDEAVAAGLGAEEGGLDPVESQGVVDLLNKELSRLLKSNPRDFWREVAGDASLHGFLDSFLKFRSRWYDFPYRGVKGTVAGVIFGELELSRRVFMVLYRLSSNRDPGARAADALSKDHGVLLQEKKLLDLPKLLDICAVYGHENEELTGSLVRNALKAQPAIHEDLSSVVSHFLGIMYTMYQRCITSLEALFSAGNHDDHGSSTLLTDLLEVMDFINDAIVSLDSFVTAYKPAALFFSCPVETSYGNEELLITLARVHDTLLPSLDRGFRIILKGQDDGVISNISISLKMLSVRLVAFGWKLLDFCYLSDGAFDGSLPAPAATKVFPATVEDPFIRADILIQSLKDINGVLLYTQENQSWNTFLQNLDKSYHVRNRLLSLQNAGWIVMEEEQLHYLSGLMGSSFESANAEPTALPMSTSANKEMMNEDAAILESKVSQIKDLFPDYGKGFLAACLDVYNQNPEEVIQRILEGTLHEDLLSLDTSLETKPTPRSTPTVSTKDKGKGKLLESDPMGKGKGKLVEPETSHWTASMSNRAVETKKLPSDNPISSSSVGRYVRKSNNMSDQYDASRKPEDVARDAALSSQYEYEDEYDDSFDDLGLSVTDSGLDDNETLRDRMRSGSGILSGKGVNPSDGKWGSRQKPQYYVKDGKNYSYKVGGSVAVANSREASLLSQTQEESIHGLGRGGNIPLGAARKLAEYQEQSEESDELEMGAVRVAQGTRGRGGNRVAGKVRGSREQQDEKSGDSEPEEGSGDTGGFSGRGRGRGRGRGGFDHHRKARAIRKHLVGLSG